MPRTPSREGPRSDTVLRRLRGRTRNLRISTSLQGQSILSPPSAVALRHRAGVTAAKKSESRGK